VPAWACSPAQPGRWRSRFPRKRCAAAPADPGLAGQAAAFQVAAAKSIAADAATIATAAAHQAHGAMGVTQEYPLHTVTRRLWA
jgi:acyl-CoA dehydrogenase